MMARRENYWVTTIIGPPKVGKTTLWKIFLKEAQASKIIKMGQSESYTLETHEYQKSVRPDVCYVKLPKVEKVLKVIANPGDPDRLVEKFREQSIKEAEIVILMLSVSYEDPPLEEQFKQIEGYMGLEYYFRRSHFFIIFNKADKMPSEPSIVSKFNDFKSKLFSFLELKMDRDVVSIRTITDRFLAINPEDPNYKHREDAKLVIDWIQKALLEDPPM